MVSANKSRFNLYNVGKQNPGLSFLMLVNKIQVRFELSVLCECLGRVLGDQHMMTQVLCNTGNLADFPLGLPNVTQVDNQCIAMYLKHKSLKGLFNLNLIN